MKVLTLGDFLLLHSFTGAATSMNILYTASLYFYGNINSQ